LGLAVAAVLYSTYQKRSQFDSAHLGCMLFNPRAEGSFGNGV